ncbi:MAG: hypothetical protein E6124_04265 [Blautia producta]|uniref:rolling circle replication-associated protein n=1 Tax=Blautia producta TaxID=33035 RepID=UPI0029104221|nr:hypothetical protein [Blautia producta]MDU5381394.1 hypothetical protein [Blautia producta]MDU6882467.1 hypothetical protein [Blautia producta]
MKRRRRYDNYDYEEAYQQDLKKEIEKKARTEFERNNPLCMDFEEEWKQQQAKLEEWEMERLLKEGKVESLYRTTTTKSRNTTSGKELLEAQIYPSFLNREDVPHTKKKRETKPSQNNLNDKNSRRYLIRLANINFSTGDLWCTFGWNEDQMPENEERARKDIKNFIRRINRMQKRAGRENIKYIYILAFDGYARPHFHMIMTGEGIDRDELEALWGKCDRPNTRRIKPDDNFLITGLATYVSQNPHGSKRWCSSKNLRKPDPPTRSYSKFKKRKVENMAKNYETLKAEMEKAYSGYKFLDAEVKYNGVNAAFYIYARMVRN